MSEKRLSEAVLHGHADDPYEYSISFVFFFWSVLRNHATALRTVRAVPKALDLVLCRSCAEDSFLEHVACAGGSYSNTDDGC